MKACKLYLVSSSIAVSMSEKPTRRSADTAPLATSTLDPRERPEALLHPQDLGAASPVVLQAQHVPSCSVVLTARRSRVIAARDRLRATDRTDAGELLDLPLAEAVSARQRRQDGLRVRAEVAGGDTLGQERAWSGHSPGRSSMNVIINHGHRPWY